MSGSTEAGTAGCPDRLAYATGQISEFQGLIRFADTKAGAAITIESGLFTVLFANFGPVLALLKQWQEWWQLCLGVLTLALSIFFFAAFMMVLYYAFLTFLPRLETKDYKPTVAFFMDVFNMKEDLFIETVSTMPQDDLVQHVLREVYLLSEILVLKFNAQRLCFQWLRLGLVLWVVAQAAILLIQ